MAAALLALPPVRVLTRVAGAAWDRLRGVQALARLAKGSSAELHFERDALREAGCLLPYDLRVELLPHLPYALRQRAWRPLFSTSEDGCSLRTMYLRLQDQGPVLLLVQARSQSAVALASPSPRPHLAPISRCRLWRQDRHERVCGGFVSGASWEPHASQYQGTGESLPLDPR